MGAHLVMKKELSKMKKKKKTSSDQAGLDGCPPGGSLRSPHSSQPECELWTMITDWMMNVCETVLMKSKTNYQLKVLAHWQVFRRLSD